MQVKPMAARGYARLYQQFWWLEVAPDRPQSPVACSPLAPRGVTLASNLRAGGRITVLESPGTAHILARRLTPEGRCMNCDTPLPGVFDSMPGTWGPRRLAVRLAPPARPVTLSHTTGSVRSWDSTISTTGGGSPCIRRAC